jgi:hypothetical protein
MDKKKWIIVSVVGFLIFLILGFSVNLLGIGLWASPGCPWPSYNTIYFFIIPIYTYEVINKDCPSYLFDKMKKDLNEENPVDIRPSKLDLKEIISENLIVAFYNPSEENDMWLLQVRDDEGVCGGMLDTDTKCYGVIKTFYNNKSFSLEKDKIIGWNIGMRAEDGAVDELENNTIVLNVGFCSVDSLDATECEEDAEVYEKELAVTVRK